MVKGVPMSLTVPLTNIVKGQIMTITATTNSASEGTVVIKDDAEEYARWEKNPAKDELEFLGYVCAVCKGGDNFRVEFQKIKHDGAVELKPKVTYQKRMHPCGRVVGGIYIIEIEDWSESDGGDEDYDDYVITIVTENSAVEESCNTHQSYCCDTPAGIVNVNTHCCHPPSAVPIATPVTCSPFDYERMDNLFKTGISDYLKSNCNDVNTMIDNWFESRMGAYLIGHSTKDEDKEFRDLFDSVADKWLREKARGWTEGFDKEGGLSIATSWATEKRVFVNQNWDDEAKRKEVAQVIFNFVNRVLGAE